MSLPDIGPHPLRPSLWAQRVSHSAPHGLDVLEAHVLAYTAEAEELAKTPWWRTAWSVSPLLAMLASIGGFAAVFGNPRDVVIGRTDAPDAGDIPWAMVSYTVAALGVVLIFIRWFETGRRRNGALQIMLALTFGFGAVGVPLAYQLAAEGGVDLEPMTMLPTYVMMALAVTVYVIIQLSPPMEPEPEVPPIPFEELSEKALTHVMHQRNEAIKTLAQRRMLPDIDVNVLKARPLGRLHIEENEG